MERLTITIVYGILIGFVLFMVFPFMVVALTQTPLDTKVDPELFNGILTSSGILFGLWALLWATLLGNRRDIERDSHYGRAYEQVVDRGQILLVYNVFFLIVSVFSLLFFVIGSLSAIYTLCFLIADFNWNTIAFLIYLLMIRRLEQIEH